MKTTISDKLPFLPRRIRCPTHRVWHGEVHSHTEFITHSRWDPYVAGIIWKCRREWLRWRFVISLGKSNIVSAGDAHSWHRARRYFPSNDVMLMLLLINESILISLFAHVLESNKSAQRFMDSTEKAMNQRQNGQKWNPKRAQRLPY